MTTKVTASNTDWTLVYAFLNLWDLARLRAANRQNALLITTFIKRERTELIQLARDRIKCIQQPIERQLLEPHIMEVETMYNTAKATVKLIQNSENVAWGAIARLATSDLKAAKAAVQKLPYLTDRNETLVKIVEILAPRDLEAAKTTAIDICGPAYIHKAWFAILKVMAKHNLAATKATIMNDTDPVFQSRALLELAKDLT